MKTQQRTQHRIPIAKPMITDDEKRRVMEVLDSGRLVAGAKVKEFEHSFADYLGAGSAVATSSGTTALQVTLEALGIGAGDTVITTPFTFVATSNAIIHAGARPLFVDVDPHTYNLDPQAVEDAFKREKARAILCVHLYGLPADLGALREIARRHSALLIEDSAQAHGARYDDRKVGTFGDAAIFSFYPSKNITTGEGGMIITTDAQVEHRARVLVNVGQDGAGEYVYEVIGYNYRMTDLSAALGLGQLEHLDEYNARRRANAARLTEGLGRSRWLMTPVEPRECFHVYNQYTIRVPQSRDRLVKYLNDQGIGTRVYYPSLVPNSPAYRRLGFAGQFPAAETLAREVLSLPVHPALAEGDLERIIEAVVHFPRDRG
ncbi:MAG: DegT/DnrJ/EryC1/StrS family aminotransferase [bacterium]